jgi:hypothetical protein
MTDALGERHHVDERIEIRAAWDARPGPDAGGIPQHWHEAPLERLARHAEKIVKGVTDLAASVAKIRELLARRRL